MTHPVQDISKQISQAFACNDTNSIKDLIADNARFVHMGITFTKHGELTAFDKKAFIYKDVAIAEERLEDYGQTAIIYKRLILTAEVNGQEVQNPFVVTEIYNQSDFGWQLAAETFTRIATDYESYQLASEGIFFE
ncbi:nuclear transport factor 2 family protein [Streptococcus ruminantium]|uniref:Nuclear transport factor 2 family protein n=1 Tax=Streptococcus ruminantium TaxID=1917441 RepID=A0ABU1B413_9STRE|nr:nuclear transport factor 2 family protein [Streptococcus ruminantium]MDQ8759861.1 nuclear transport factor 2 family protein [Streptococcus ruminantium]MDQ8769178.1 nuclear transport factor 2 family protein [Streptococcus ruminantium]MDQ8773827.1 nuclear transport factor 2 family protein [Streptococcus ruminantium]MDQ8793548.1 nuclear transport factor 2 family protein [Streptococcus ruminantium]MDQ8795058.1 nuclear transport factor 2 family protein [Streptococcus ruminantium]